MQTDVLTRPRCTCHDEPMQSNGVKWQCAVKQRNRARRYRRANPEKGRKREQRWRQNNPDRDQARRLRRYQSIRAELLEELGGQCVVCGTTNSLDVHHINGNGAEHRGRIGGPSGGGSPAYYLDILRDVRAGSEDYELLCRTHHLSRH